MTEIRAWTMDNDDALVWGTHDPAEAAKAYNEFVDDDLLEAEDVRDWSRKYWGYPELIWVEEEIWPASMISREPVEGWVPYLVIEW